MGTFYEGVMTMGDALGYGRRCGAGEHRRGGVLSLLSSTGGGDRADRGG